MTFGQRLWRAAGKWQASSQGHTDGRETLMRLKWAWQGFCLLRESKAIVKREKLLLELPNVGKTEGACMRFRAHWWGMIAAIWRALEGGG